MANIKISPKGKALLSKGYSSGRVLNAIVAGGEKLYTKEGLEVMVDGMQVKVKSASSDYNGKQLSKSSK